MRDCMNKAFCDGFLAGTFFCIGAAGVMWMLMEAIS